MFLLVFMPGGFLVIQVHGSTEVIELLATRQAFWGLRHFMSTSELDMTDPATFLPARQMGYFSSACARGKPKGKPKSILGGSQVGMSRWQFVVRIDPKKKKTIFR